MALDHENEMVPEIFMSSNICVFYRPDLYLVCKLHKISPGIYNFGINQLFSLLSIIAQILNLIDSVLRKIMGFQYFTDQVCKMTSSEIFYDFEFYFWIKLFLLSFSVTMPSFIAIAYVLRKILRGGESPHPPSNEEEKKAQ